MSWSEDFSGRNCVKVDLWICSFVPATRRRGLVKCVIPIASIESV